LVLAAASSSWGVKTATISLLEVFAGLIAALPAAVFLGMAVGVLGNFRYLFIFWGFWSVRVLFLGFAFCLCSFSSVLSLGSCSVLLVSFRFFSVSLSCL